MNNINFTKVYANMGKILCGLAGGIVGFVLGGIYLTIPWIVIGVVAGDLMERKLSKS